MISRSPAVWNARNQFRLGRIRRKNNEHGITGWRCRTFGQFVWACNNIHKIDRRTCRNTAISKYSYEKVSGMYEEWFNSIKTIYNGGKGFYDEMEVVNLDYLSPLDSSCVELISHNIRSKTPIKVTTDDLKLIPFKPQHYLEIYRNFHKGKTGWLLCTGPGLNELKPQSNLSDKNVYFGVNSIIFSRFKTLVDYYFSRTQVILMFHRGGAIKKEDYRQFKPRRGKFYSQHISEDGSATLFQLRTLR